MLVRPDRRPRPAVAAFLAGVLLACAYLMWGPGHTSAMAMSGPMPTMAVGKGMAAEAGKHPAVSDAGHDGCPATSLDCPLATAYTPLPLTAPPGPAALAQPPVAAAEFVRGTEDGCPRPRAPDPVALLCVSRT
ncbi:hypothetical protein [Streptomyces sp. H27-S2]|uniref:hypothetical protein n=1 Tax=Streptomyces antarcticus TaxID=2996458 RepID=UPI00226F3D0D|nr:hypothetical protein [Streptomyces sp. H27-S2]MCY0952122.1 hypothetical protein [Streptomyces sp. H27-S2]